MCNVKKGFLWLGMTELSKGWKDSNHVFVCIMKMIGCHGIEGHQKIAYYYNAKEFMACV